MAASPALTAVRQLLTTVGYPEGSVRSDVATADLQHSRIDVVAYGRPNGPYDASTATIVVEIVNDVRQWPSANLLPLAGFALSLSVPAVILADQQRWSLFAVDPEGTLRHVQELSWREDLGGLAGNLSPAALLDAKLGSRQLSLFPLAAQVSQRGRNRRERALAPRVTEALDAANLTYSGEAEATTAEDHTKAARLVIGALTTVVLRDKAAAATIGAATLSADVLVNRAITDHRQQFGWLQNAPIEERELLELLVDRFSDVDFSNVEPALLSELYEKLLVDDSHKRNLGAHYTPPGLARRILSWLPIEEIDPDERRAYDATCGSGSLLIAAHDRIRDLQSPELDLATSHRELVTRIRGGDVDPVAAGIANLALFLNALPAGNGWQIDVADVYAVTPAVLPTILIANPPWKYTNQGHQDDDANRILERLVSWTPPGGLLGVVLPTGWLTRGGGPARASREHLFATHEVLEVWRLPGGTFSSADVGAAVVLARRPPTGRPRPIPSVRRRITMDTALTDFYEVGAAYASLAHNLKPHELGNGRLKLWWQTNSRTRPTKTIGDYVTVVTGPQPESPAKLAERDSAKRPNTAVIASWAKVPAYGDVHAAPARRVRFPDDMQNGSRRGGEIIGRKSIMFSAGKNPERPWRVKVAIDPVGDRIPKNTAKALLPRDPKTETPPPRGADPDTILYGLFAFLGSGFVAAWLDEAVTTRNLPPDELRAIPAPDPDVLHQLATIGKQLYATADKGEWIEQIEQIVWRWVGAPNDVRADVVRRLNQGEAPEGGRRYPVDESTPTESDASRPTSPIGAMPTPRVGAVLSVYDDDEGVRIAVPGITPHEGWVIPLPTRLPAALLVEGAAFTVTDTGQPLRDLSFKFDELAYMSDDAVLEELEAWSGPPAASDV